MPDRIVVLDGYTLTPAMPDQAAPSGEPTWDALASRGKLTVYERTAPGELLDRARGASILMTNKTPITAQSIAALPELKYIGVLATGVNVVDLDAAEQAGVTVTNIPGYSGDAVAQHVFALMLEMTNRVAAHDSAVHAGKWAGCQDFCFTLSPLVELSGKTLGIIGAGDIGKRVARIGHAMGMRIMVVSRTEKEMGEPVRWADTDQVFQEADVISLHCPLTDETRHLVNAQRLSHMKRSAYLINTARGPLIDEHALASALKDSVIAGAALDVLGTEPPSPDNPLLTAPNCIITPHNAWAAREARHRLMLMAVDNLRMFQGGEPMNKVCRTSQ